MWGSIANKLYFSAGPDCTNGDGNQAWPPANVFTLPSNIYGIAPSSQGLCVFTDDSFWVVLGGPQTLSFYIQPVLQNMGILSANCLMQDGDTLYLFTSNRQLIELQFSGKDEIGFAIADQLLAFSPATSSLAIHRNGQDEGLFISDGSASVFRYSLRRTAWSTKATIVGGIGIIKSIETTAGTYTLLAGRPTGSDFILGRSLSSFLDGATTYSGFATIGSLVLSTPGTNHLVRIQNFTLEYTTAGTDLTLSVLPNELSGSFTTIPFNTTDPYQLTASSTVKMRRHDWLGVQSMLPNAVKHLQVKVTLPTENAANELIGFGINPTVQS
jgi:hypothetical protein